jgi:hypothetical protein
MTRPINIPPFYDRPKEAGEVWTLRKDGRVASCNLWTHPIGGEVRVTVNGELVRGEANRDSLTLVDRGLEWKAQFQEKGWHG